MSAISTLTGFATASFEAFLQSRAEPGWLKDQRRAAWRTFESLPMPNRNDEEWMRTDIRLFRLDRFQLPFEPSTPKPLPAALLRHGVELDGSMETLDSRCVSTALDAKWAQR